MKLLGLTAGTVGGSADRKCRLRPQSLPGASLEGRGALCVLKNCKASVGMPGDLLVSSFAALASVHALAP